jgi:hypothetical protein
MRTIEWATIRKAEFIGLGAFVIAAAIEIGSSVWPDKIKPHPYMFVSFLVFGLLCVIVPLAHTIYVWAFSRFRPILPVASSLEIIFEPLNPARRFWSLIGYLDDLGKGHSYWEHRVEIRNISQKTIRNVMVTVERIGPSPQLPFSPPFKRSQLEKCDINPGCSELIQVNTWPHPKAQVGMFAGPSAWGYGPIKVTVSGDDTLSVVKTFAFNYETDQMLFDMEVY